MQEAVETIRDIERKITRAQATGSIDGKPLTDKATIYRIILHTYYVVVRRLCVNLEPSRPKQQRPLDPVVGFPSVAYLSWCFAAKQSPIAATVGL